jgi:PLP dependent protein
MIDELNPRLENIRNRIAIACARVNRDPESVTLIAVSKTVDCPIIAAMSQCGQNHFGENRPQELWRKANTIPDAAWHLVGHLQRNKIEKTIPLTTLIHSVDSERLLIALHDFGMKRQQPIPILLEVNCSREPAKSGFDPQAIPRLHDRILECRGVEIQGLMTMAAYHEDPELCRPAFRELREIRESLRQTTGLKLPFLSMGMSHDFEIAIEEGATHIRIGTLLFEGLGK